MTEGVVAFGLLIFKIEDLPIDASRIFDSSDEIPSSQYSSEE